MAITGAIEIADLVPSETSRELAKLQSIIKKDNVKDLAKSQKDKFTTYAQKQNKTNLENPDNSNPDNDFLYDNALDKRIEEEFDKYLLKLGITNISDTSDRIKRGNMAALKDDFNAYLQKEFSNDSEFSQYMNLLKNAEIKDALQAFSFELEELSQEVIDSLDSNPSGESNISYETGNTLLDDKGKKTPEGSKKEAKKENTTENKETHHYDATKDYLAPYEDTQYATLTAQQDIENIYRDNKLAKVMEKVFDDEEAKELRRGTFKVNIGKENGLAGIIIAIREAIANKDNSDGNNIHKKCYDALIDKGVLHQSGNSIDLDFSRKDLKELIKDGILTYKHEGGLDFEVNKVAKILDRAQRTDLDTFASLLQSKSDMTMAVKEWSNAKEMTGNDAEHPGEDSLISTDNVLKFLCDFNSDAQISAAYRRRNNKEQKNQGDVGTLFGQQILWTIDQTIDVQNVVLGYPRGEQLVIGNVIKNMKISDSRSLESIHITSMKNDPSMCTKENLAKLVNGSPSEGIPAMPEMKIFFLDAIKKINGGSTMIQPDLADTLSGKDAISFMARYESQEAEVELKTTLDELLSKSKDPKIKEAIRLHGLVRVRETLFTSIMHAIDNLAITTNDGTQTNILAAGVSKGREIHALKKELLDSTIKNLILSGIHYTSEGGLILSIGYGREGQSENYRTKRNRGANGGVILTGGKVEIMVSLSAGIAEQYNHKKVINADLSKVKSAKYLGIEGGVLGDIGLENKGVEAEAYAGINRQQDPEAGINQIDKQYRAVSEEIFDINGASPSILSDKTKFSAYIMSRIDNLGTDDIYGNFVDNNHQHLSDDLAFMLRYMEENTFFGTEGLFAKAAVDPKVNITSITNSLLDILQSGNIEQRRHDVIAELHGKISLTKLSFGVTTNAFTLASGMETPPPPPHTGVDGSPTGTPQEKSQDRFGIYGLYVGARISTWRNMYVPNVAQYLFTQYETEKGLGLETISFEDKNLDSYGKYLIALYHDQPQNRLSYYISNNTLVLNFDAQGSDLTLAKFLNIHATSAAEKGFSLKGNTLTIGNVGDMASYTITEGTGVRRILSLGTKQLDKAHRITGDVGTVNVEPVAFEEVGNTPWTQEKINTDIISKMSGSGKDVETAKTTTAAFFDAEGRLQVPTTGFAGATIRFEYLDGKTIEGMKLTNGTLTIRKSADGLRYTLNLDPITPADKLTIKYIDETEYNQAMSAAEAISENREVTEVASSSEIQALFAMPSDVTNVFKNIEKTLSIFDDHQQTLYKKFMEDIVDGGLDAFIDAKNYTQAFATLQKILATNIKYDQLPGLRSLMEKDLSHNEQILIVDKFKTIFSYITYLSDGKNDGKNLSELISSTRKNVYTKMKGPDEMTPYPLTTDYRKMILANIKGENELTRTPVDNLVGFTAFYRLHGEGRKYAMTPVGGTNVLTGSSVEESMMSINATDKVAAQEWFISNLAVNTENKTMLIEKINLLLAKKNITITAEQLAPLLKGESIAIDSSKKISIDINRVFYLLGECANESIGMELKNIKIEEFKQALSGEYTASGIPEKEYKGGMKLVSKNDSITSVELTQEEKVDWRHAQALPKLDTPPPPAPTDADPEVPPPPPPTDADPGNP